MIITVIFSYKIKAPGEIELFFYHYYNTSCQGNWTLKMTTHLYFYIKTPENWNLTILFFKDVLKFNFRDRGREGEKELEKNINMWLPLTHPPYWGHVPQPRYVPWLGIKLVTLCFAVQWSIHWATPARVHYSYSNT